MRIFKIEKIKEMEAVLLKEELQKKFENLNGLISNEDCYEDVQNNGHRTGLKEVSAEELELVDETAIHYSEEYGIFFATEDTINWILAEDAK